MARRTPSAFDYSIAYDDGERSRAALERNLQNTELSLHLSSHPSSDDYSVEFPRHNSGPQPSFSNFRSIEYSYDGEHDGQHDESSHVNAWSYRTLDEEEGITHPTMSTAAHHASALTISAGLGGRAGHRRREDISLSGAEYDPERPLDHLVANLSALDADDTRSRTQNHYDQRPQRQTRAAPSASSSASDSSSGPATPPAGSPRGNLSAHLAHLTFSPKRPRSPAHAKSRSATHARRAQSPLQTHDDPTPRARKVRSSSSAHAHGHAHLQPEINVRPPTPSTADSKFTRMARSLARDIEAAQADGNLAQSTLRGGNKGQPRQQSRRAEDVYGNSRGDGYSRTGVHLPDVTGLTAAVETPLKGGVRHYPYKDDGRADTAGKARLVEMLGLVQSRLLQLEGENAGAARRMRELEAELESCRADVASERARMLRRESEQDEILRRVESANTKARAANDKMMRENERSRREVVEGEQRRYREAVEEKKALEQLIGTLRGHMARLTDELAGQQGLLDELRGMREADASTLHDKVREVDHLRTEVERVAGEVEVLKGFVEEGLRERRARHPDASQIPLPSEEEEEESERERSPSPAPTEPLTDDELAPAPRSPVQNRNQTYDDSQSLYYAPPPPVADRTTRTDRATVDTSRPSPRPYVEQSEIDRIAEELSERRSASRSGSLAGSMSSAAPSRQSSRPGSVLSGSGSRRVASPTPAPARPTAPTPAHAAGQHQQQAPVDDSPVPQRPRRSKDKGKSRAQEQETPFPQIRGERLEKLFFSAPAHNARTCAVCARRSGSKKSKQPLWSRVPSGSSRPRTQARGEEEVDEGFEEGSDADNHSVPGSPTSPESPNLDFLRPGARLPPQTVLVRVLRELEDDFTHYKGIYLELAQQYGLMDPVSNVAKRNVLAEHLKEVIDVLEQRGDQIASLYDLLTYEDKPDTKGKQTQPESRAARPESRATGSRKHAVFV